MDWPLILPLCQFYAPRSPGDWLPPLILGVVDNYFLLIITILFLSFIWGVAGKCVPWIGGGVGCIPRARAKVLVLVMWRIDSRRERGRIIFVTLQSQRTRHHHGVSSPIPGVCEKHTVWIWFRAGGGGCFLNVRWQRQRRPIPNWRR